MHGQNNSTEGVEHQSSISEVMDVAAEYATAGQEEEKYGALLGIINAQGTTDDCCEADTIRLHRFHCALWRTARP